MVATPGQGPDRPQEVSYTDTKVIGNGSFGVVYQAKLCDSGEMVAIKKVLQDKRFKVRIVLHQTHKYQLNTICVVTHTLEGSSEAHIHGVMGTALFSSRHPVQQFRRFGASVTFDTFR